MTRLDVMVVLGMMAILGIVLHLSSAGRQAREDRGQCRVRLKWLGVDYTQYANDHQGELPWRVDTVAGGSLDYVATPDNVKRHYLAMSEYVAAPSLLLCPQDDRLSAASWASLSDSNISYFLNLSTESLATKSVLGGDRYLTTNSMMLHGFFQVESNSHVKWARNFHNYAGYLLYADGSVAMARSNLVQEFFLVTNRAAPRLAIP